MATGTVQKNLNPSIVELASFTGTAEQNIALASTSNQFLFLCMVLYDSNGNIINCATATPSVFQNVTCKIYGSSSSQWGSFVLSNDYARGTFNRTSANTSMIKVFGCMK